MGQALRLSIVMILWNCVGVVSVQAQSLPEPLKLADGLLANDLPELAMQYLDKLAASNSLAKDVEQLLPLKRAEVRLALADLEENPTQRGILLDEARNELNQFLAQNPDSPRRADASLSLARLLNVQAMGELRAANNIDDTAQRQSAKVQARPTFKKAFQQYETALQELTTRIEDKNLPKPEVGRLVNTLYDAELEAARTQLELANTYETNNAGTEQVVERGEVLNAAFKRFDALGQKSDTQPQSWEAKAWKGEVYAKQDRPVDAEKAFQEVLNAVRRNPTAQAGARQVRFFEMRDAFLSAAGSDQRGEKIALINRAEKLAQDWLAGQRSNRGQPSREEFAAKWYLANLIEMQAQLRISVTKDKNGQSVRIVPDMAKGELRRAAKLFGTIARTQNAYSGRAAKKKSETQVLLIGDGTKKPSDYTSFDECLMAAQVQLYRYLTEPGDNPEAKKTRIIQLYERLDELPPGPDDAEAAEEAKVDSVYAYIRVDRPFEGAILGDHLARTLLTPELATQAGVYAIQAYLATANNAPVAMPTTRTIDQQRAIDLARYLESEYPTDPGTDKARILLGQLQLRRENSAESFAILSRVGASGPQLAAARLLEGIAAYNLLRIGKSSTAQRPDGVPDKPKELAAYQANVYRQAVADLSQVTAPPKESPEEATRMAVLVDLQLAELHLTQAKAGYKKAEAEAVKAAKIVAAAKNLSDDLRKELQWKADYTKLRAIYAQAVPEFKNENYAAVMKRIQPLLNEIDKAGPAEAEGQEPAVAAAAERLDNFRRDSIIVLAMQTRIRQGEIDKAGDIFKLLKKLGGGADSVAQALGQLAKSVAPQIDKLQKENKTEEAETMTEGVGKLLALVANDKEITPPAIFNLGRAMKDVGSYDKAIELLNRIEKPSDELLNKPVNTLDNAERLTVLLYRNAQLELARVHRLAGDFDQAKAILTAAMGDLDDPQSKGWASDSIEFRKEVAYLSEDRAEALDDRQAAALLWQDALQRWSQLGSGYLAYLRKPLSKDPDEAATQLRLRNQVQSLYHEIYYEQTRCLLRANTHLLAAAPDKLEEKYQKIAEDILALEKANPEMASATQSRLGELIATYPGVESAYKAGGGVAFLAAYQAEQDAE